jgi:hypothetical protein
LIALERLDELDASCRAQPELAHAAELLELVRVYRIATRLRERFEKEVLPRIDDALSELDGAPVVAPDEEVEVE